MKNKLESYTEQAFTEIVKRLINDLGSEGEIDTLLELFITITGHPDGADLIYYPEESRDGSAESIIHIIKQWRAKNGKPAFKQG